MKDGLVRIGLTTYCREAAWGDWRKPAALVPMTYLHGVVSAGGTPLLLPPIGTDELVLDGLDGLIVIGGADMEAESYGHVAHPLTQTERGRDAHEIALVRGALARGLPLLAICRGMQVLNVASGGTLVQHLPEVLGHESYRPEPGVFGRVEFTTEPDSTAAQVLGSSGWAPCYHHQAVDHVGDGLRVTARSEDGVVQALEPDVANAGWALGVQFHPEENPDDTRLFDALVEAARTYQTRREEATL
ncbi:gamma-glutamyl-gamma-aminobutyrate hydrolase family protein [Demetria terragena]|uniref:gamma-glutamyl-gamma-aminobutyrate hydrolase family protein n=1 Tax=Demetria terragena TaxID=63959 RepID=UPI000370653C|nr:gamma-glutamyl-gamma-aminobutyrate hydrolase family protein [Demetria terragena]